MLSAARKRQQAAFKAKLVLKAFVLTGLGLLGAGRVTHCYTRFRLKVSIRTGN